MSESNNHLLNAIDQNSEEEKNITESEWNKINKDNLLSQITDVDIKSRFESRYNELENFFNQKGEQIHSTTVSDLQLFLEAFQSKSKEQSNEQVSDFQIGENMKKVVQYITENGGKGVIRNLHNVIINNNNLFGFPQEIIDAFDGVRNSREKQYKLGKYFLEKGYFFNGSMDRYGGDVLIRIEGGQILGSKSGNEKLFGSKDIGEYKYYLINDSNFQMSGNSFGGVAVVNIPKNQESYKRAGKEICETSEFAKNVKEDDYGNSMANNEIAHEILKQKYNFYNDTKHDWSQLEVGVSGYIIPNSQQVHEFISDVASINTSIADLSRLLSNALTDIQLGKKDGKLVSNGYKNKQPQYEYTNLFIFQLISEIFEEKGIKTIRFIEGAELTTDIANNMIEVLDTNDFKRIQEAYLNQGNILLTEINSITRN